MRAWFAALIARAGSGVAASVTEAVTAAAPATKAAPATTIILVAAGVAGSGADVVLCCLTRFAILKMKLARTYLLLAIIATLFNIGVQDVSTRLYSGPYALLLAACAGTGAGLVLKYLLDKRYIFRFRADSLGHDGRVFLLYTVAGLATTVIFWGFEFGFHYLFDSREGRYAGAAIGLGIGYLCKYQLDKRYVFRTAAA